MTTHKELTSYRECGHEGVDELLWVTTDTGAFGHENDGPLRDWIKGKDNILEHAEKFDTVVQAGGNCGMYARFYKNYFKEVYTFEPDELNYYCLDANCQGEDFHKFLGGLGNTREKFSLKAGSETNVGTHKIVESAGDVQMYMLDDMNLNHCDLIHYDLEGYEETALKGSIETIKRFKPVIVVERLSGSDLLENLGYKEHGRTFMDHIYIYNA